MLRKPLASERIQRIDPNTGIKVIQITSYPTPSLPLSYAWPYVTPDNARLILMCQREARHGAPWDLFRCDTDGLNLFQLTERDQEKYPPLFDKPTGNKPTATLSLDGMTLYVVWHGDPILYTVDVETGDLEEFCSLEKVCPAGVIYQYLCLAASSNRLFIVFRKPSISAARIDLGTGEVTELELDGLLWACVPTMPRLIIVRKSDIPQEKLPDYVSFVQSSGTRTLWSVDEDGEDPRFICVDPFAHATMLGGTDRIQGCGKPPDRCIWIAEEGKEPEKIVQGPYFWHSGASWDGEWILSDTNWPDDGLQLVHVPSRHFRTLCQARASQDHVRAGHPHPALSHDGRIGVFTSDRSGMAQVYVAHIIEDFRESVKAGDLDGSSKWM